MPVLSSEETIRRLAAIWAADDFGEAAHELGGITKEALQEWARDNPSLVPPSTYKTMLTASERQREHLARARGGQTPGTIRTAEVPGAALRYRCLGPCGQLYPTYPQVISHRRGKGAECKGAGYNAVLPEGQPPWEQEVPETDDAISIEPFLPHAEEEDDELLRAIVATLNERDLLREQAARRRTVWSSVRERLLGRG